MDSVLEDHLDLFCSVYLLPIRSTYTIGYNGSGRMKLPPIHTDFRFSRHNLSRVTASSLQTNSWSIPAGNKMPSRPSTELKFGIRQLSTTYLLSVRLSLGCAIPNDGGAERPSNGKVLREYYRD